MRSELLDLGGYPEIHADAIGDVIFIGPKTMIYLYETRPVNGVLRRVISGLVIRPTESLTAAQLANWHSAFVRNSGVMVLH